MAHEDLAIFAKASRPNQISLLEKGTLFGICACWTLACTRFLKDPAPFGLSTMVCQFLLGTVIVPFMLLAASGPLYLQPEAVDTKAFCIDAFNSRAARLLFWCYGGVLTACALTHAGTIAISAGTIISWRALVLQAVALVSKVQINWRKLSVLMLLGAVLLEHGNRRVLSILLLILAATCMAVTCEPQFVLMGVFLFLTPILLQSTEMIPFQAMRERLDSMAYVVLISL